MLHHGKSQITETQGQRAGDFDGQIGGSKTIDGILIQHQIGIAGKTQNCWTLGAVGPPPVVARASRLSSVSLVPTVSCCKAPGWVMVFASVIDLVFAVHKILNGQGIGAAGMVCRHSPCSWPNTSLPAPPIRVTAPASAARQGPIGGGAPRCRLPVPPLRVRCRPPPIRCGCRRHCPATHVGGGIASQHCPVHCRCRQWHWCRSN